MYIFTMLAIIFAVLIVIPFIMEYIQNKFEYGSKWYKRLENNVNLFGCMFLAGIFGFILSIASALVTPHEGKITNIPIDQVQYVQTNNEIIVATKYNGIFRFKYIYDLSIINAKKFMIVNQVNEFGMPLEKKLKWE